MRIIANCTDFLDKYPGKFKEDPAHKEQTATLFFEWLSDYPNFNRKIKALSIADVKWLAYAHSLACEHRFSRIVTREEARKTHGFARMVLKEWNFRAHKWRSIVPKLELQCVAHIVFCPEVELDANFSRDNVFTVDFNIDSMPNVNDWEAEGDWDDLDDPDFLFPSKKDEEKKKGVDENGTGKKKSKSAPEPDEKEPKVVDFTEPGDSGDLAHFTPGTLQPSLFAADCSRLFYWRTLYENFLDEHKVIDMSGVHSMTQYEGNVMRLLTKQCQYENTQTNTVFELLFKLHLPIGAKMAYERVHQTRSHTFTKARDVLVFDAGAAVARRAAEKMVAIPSKVIHDKACKSDKIFECWALALFHQRLVLCQCDFIKEFVYFSESILEEKEFLGSEKQWKVRTRRPVLIKLCGVWYVQIKGELRQCTDVVQALATWAFMMATFYESRTSSRVDLSSVLSGICART